MADHIFDIHVGADHAPDPALTLGTMSDGSRRRWVRPLDDRRQELRWRCDEWAVTRATYDCVMAADTIDALRACQQH
jgi:hypothetical protein